ncbi:GNAT family N-acetyltransferase [Actinoallomurus sp. NPDC050550]|uniref:GNAT family N-acetyltransferase n=1 Tax=Actinoallomurus sp. NPDC050550 TaxID=3154937 RepID=UPI0033C63D3C
MATASNGGIIVPAAIQLTGSGLILREWDDDDVPAMAELFDEPHIDRWAPLRAPFDQAAARAYLDLARRRRAAGRRLQLAITTDGHRPLGEILLFPTGAPGEVELAYAIGAAHRRQRLAGRAVQLITAYAYAYDTLAATRVIVRIPAGNTASAAVARTAGFQLTTAPLISREGARDPLHTWLHRPLSTPPLPDHEATGRGYRPTSRREAQTNERSE